jgi:hypothetical protein
MAFFELQSHLLSPLHKRDAEYAVSQTMPLQADVESCGHVMTLRRETGHTTVITWQHVKQNRLGFAIHPYRIQSWNLWTNNKPYSNILELRHSYVMETKGEI